MMKIKKKDKRVVTKKVYRFELNDYEFKRLKEFAKRIEQFVWGTDEANTEYKLNISLKKDSGYSDYPYEEFDLTSITLRRLFDLINETEL